MVHIFPIGFYHLYGKTSIYLFLNFLSPSLTLNALTYPLPSGNIKTNDLIILSKYPIKYLESLLFQLILR